MGSVELRASWNRFGSLGVCCAALFGLWRCQEAAVDAPCNVLWISIDTLRADALGCYGNPSARTPHLDALARQSTVFREVQAPSPWTLPAHATMFTGLAPEHHGVLGERDRLAPELKTFAERCRSRGYATAAFTDSGYLHERFGLLRGFADAQSDGGGFSTVSARASDWLNERNSDRRRREPWMIFVHCYDVHSVVQGPLPYHSDADLRAQFVAEIPARLQGDSSVLEEAMLRAEPIAAEDRAVLRALYDAAVATLDRKIGAWLAALDTAGHLENTVICVVSDHGEGFAEHGLLGHSTWLYQEFLRVPWILHVPGETPSVVHTPAGLIDVAPTLAALCELPAVSPAPDGLALLSAETGSRVSTERSLTAVMVANDVSWIAHMRKRGFALPIDARAVRYGSWKGIDWAEPARSDRFDLSTDAGELSAQLARLDVDDAREAALRALHQAVPLIAPHRGESLPELLRSLGYVR